MRTRSSACWPISRGSFREGPERAVGGSAPSGSQAEADIGLTLRTNLEWVSEGYFVDTHNTMRNLTDGLHSNSVSVDDASGRVFGPYLGAHSSSPASSSSPMSTSR